jgi:phenylalanyl-tRNA synthetase alpha chain
MDIQGVVKNLHPLELKILRFFGAEAELCVERVEAELGFKAGNGNQALSWLAGKGIVCEKRRETAVFYELTAQGRAWREQGTPEERIVALAKEQSGLKLPDFAARLALENKDVGSAFGALSKAGLLTMDAAKTVTFTGQAGGTAVNPALRAVLEKAAAEADGLVAESALEAAEKTAAGAVAKKRGAADAAFRMVERETVYFGFEPCRAAIVAALEAAGLTGDETGALTPELLASGAWKNRHFRAYNVRVPPSRLLSGRSNAYSSFLESVKDKLAGLGFEEFDGPLVETEFWNCDALFMPQFHSARDIHDVYRITDPLTAKSIEEPWLSNVAAAHENGGKTGSRGWNYAFDRDFTRRLILRSQGTVMSAKTLPHAKIPGKYFGMLRCFRYDKVDATHLADFYQTEGIVLGDQVNLRTLLGMLEMFAVEVAGAKEVKYVPGYFPFTEPSVEVHIKHPVLGWFELGGSGIFRPEVTSSLGIDVPVAAWGIGIDRMALMALGLSDLRELFSYDIENVRLRRAG